MKLVVFGLSISSSWGNGHATLWRGLCAALARQGHHVIFFERDVSYYAAHRDYFEIPGGELFLYSSWTEIRLLAARHVQDADVAMVTSYCPDSREASELVLSSRAAVHAFYDLDAPVTLCRVRSGLPVDYLPARKYSDFDIVLSYTGGSTLAALEQELGAKKAVPLYGSVDPARHSPAASVEAYSGDLSYLGTYAADRQAKLTELFVEPARRRPRSRFTLGGSMYDDSFPWTPNIYYLSHVPTADHPAFYCSSRLTLNVTRQAMAEFGYCPSGRLFEATACGAPVLTDQWPGLEFFFQPGSEILVADQTQDSLAALDRSPEELRRIAQAGRARTLEQHTADCRARELESIVDQARQSVSQSTAEALADVEAR